MRISFRNTNQLSIFYQRGGSAKLAIVHKNKTLIRLSCSGDLDDRASKELKSVVEAWLLHL